MSVVKVVEYPSSDFSSSEISRREILRYMKCKETSPEIEALIDSALRECTDKLTYKIAYREFNIAIEKDHLDLGFLQVDSRDLAKALNNCDSIILFAATIGLEIDRSILKYSRLSPALALCIQAVGAERIEALCDRFFLDLQGKFALQHSSLTPRFSPGYGDLPIEIQREIFTALSCEKNIGLTLNESFLMSPTKSVTAIIGIKNPLFHKE